MGKKIIRAGVTRKEAEAEARAITNNLKKRGIKREAYVTPLSRRYVQSLTRKGYPVPKKNFGIAVRNILRTKSKGGKKR